MRDSVADLTQQIEELTTRIANTAATHGESEAGVTRDLLRKLERLERERRNALAHQLGVESEAPKERETWRAVRTRTTQPGRTPPGPPVTPVRERVLAGLELLGVPARGGLVSAAAAARTGIPVEARQLASLRRSERASWQSAPDRRPAYVVPALHIRRFDPLRGFVASSAWEEWRRIVGPLSTRADHLRATIRLGDNILWAREHSEDLGERYERLLWRLGRSVPGVLESESFDVEKVIESARAELAILDADDRAERDEAAKRLAKLPAAQRLFGAGLEVAMESEG